MSSAGGTSVKYAKSSLALVGVFGTAIATPAFKPLRLTTDALKANFKNEESKELVSNYRVAGFRRVGIDAGGQLGTEFVFGNLDDLLESLFFSIWQRTPQRYNATSDTQISDVTAATGVITVLAAVADDPNRWGAYAVAQLLRSTGFTNAGNNFLKRATAAGATSVTVSTAGLVDEAAPPLGARVKVVGVEAPAAGNISLTTAGLGAGEVAIINGTGIDFVACGIVAGMWLKGAVFPITANNGWFRVLNVTTTRLGLDIAPSGVATDTAAAAQVRLYMPDYLRDGILAATWFDIERALPQLTVPEWHYGISHIPKALNFSLTPQGIATCTMDFVGSTRSSGTARVAGATDITADALSALPRVGEMFDTSSNVAQVKQGNTSLVGTITQAGFSIDNGISGLPVVGQLGAGRILKPRFRPSINLTSYYDSRALLAFIEADTAVGVSTVLTDPLGTRAFIIDYPSTKLLSGDPDGIQVDSEINQPIQLAAFANMPYACAAQLQRFEEYS